MQPTAVLLHPSNKLLIPKAVSTKMTTQKRKTNSNKEIDILKTLKKFSGKHSVPKKNQVYEKQAQEISFKNLFSTSTYLKQELGTAYFSPDSQDFYSYEPHSTPLGGAKKSSQNDRRGFLETVCSEKKSDDNDLISLISEQMLLAERELQMTRMHLIETKNKLNERDIEVQGLKEKVKALQRSASRKANERSGEGGEVLRDRSLTETLKKLKKQVRDMEEFLNDYGLVWVGDDDPECEPDFDKIIQSFQRLNSVACQPKITQTPSGAKFELPREIPLVLYSNGFLLRDTDFREYSRTSTKLFLLDVEDGYFPSELQTEYPEGVPFQVLDRRSERYEPQRNKRSFQTQGNRLGSAAEVSNLEVKKPISKKNDSNTDRVLKLKIRLEGSTQEFVVEMPKNQKMHVLQKFLSEKLCDTLLEDDNSSYTLVEGSLDFRLHVYGSDSFRLSECLNMYPEDCGIVKNCVVNVTALKSSS